MKLLRRPRTGSRNKISRGVSLLAVSALALPLAVVGINNALATSHTDFGPYDIDGVVADSIAGNAIDDPSGSVKELGPLNGSTTKIGVIHNDAVPTLGLTNPNAQVDLDTAWLHLQRHTDGKDYLYFAWERDSNSGSGFIAYEFMKNSAPSACAYNTLPAGQADLIADCNPFANRSAGDFMILWDQQGGNRALTLRRWTGTGSNLTLEPGNVNVLDAFSRAEYSSDGFRGEAAVNLTGAGLAAPGSCLTIANTIPSTVTGNSDTADYKDTILTTKQLSNCGAVSFTKQDDLGGALQGAWFTLYTDAVPAKSVAYNKSTYLPAASLSGATTLTVADASGFPSAGKFQIRVDGGDPLTVNSRTNNVLTLAAGAPADYAKDVSVVWNGTCSPTGASVATCSLVGLPFGTYTLAETTTPAGYTTAGDKTFTISATDPTGTLSSMPHTFINNRAPITITVRKSDDASPVVPLAGATFGLFEDKSPLASGTAGPSLAGFSPVVLPAAPTMTTLAGAVTALASTLEVASVASHPAVPYWLRLGTGSGVEDVKVTARTGTTLTVLRGQQLTTAAAWPDLAVVSLLTGNDPLVKQCLTAAVTGSCDLTTVYPGDYVLDETGVPAGYAKPSTLPAPVGVVAGDPSPRSLPTASGYYEDPRLFKVITLVCKAADSSLYRSEVTYSGTGLSSGQTAVKKSLHTGVSLPAGVEEAELCGLGGATLEGVQKGTYGASTVIGATPATP